MATQSSPMLEAENVSKVYSSHTALRNINLIIPRQSIFGLLGPNGAGKTSFIRIINQITGPDTGKILMNGVPLHPDHINNIGYLPEERGLYKKMEVGEQALYLARLKGLSRADAVSRLKMWFEKFGITGWWRKKIEELSKGMQQKVQFIVTVVHNPSLLILDEPFTGFDPINANLVKDELIRLNKEGTTIILSTHRMESVEELCSHIALINQSEKILDGAVRDIRRQYKSNLFEITYTGNNIGLANSLWGGFELVSSSVTEDHSQAIIRIAENENSNHLLSGLLQNVQVTGFREVIPSMNDIFIQTVTKNTPAHA